VVLHQPSQLREFIRLHIRDNFRVLYVPKDATVIQHWRQVGVIAYAAGNLTLCIDELGMLCENGQFRADEKGKSPILESIVHYGRHRNLVVIATAQRPTDVALRFRALCSQFRIFQTVEKQDLDYLEPRIGETCVSLLPKLPKYDFVVWTETGEIYRGRTAKM
jgi:hypothetical protein